MSVSGLLTQKLDSPVPEAGNTARFSIEVRPKKSGDGTWNKLKNEKGDFGSEYKILKADRKDDYTHPEHGAFAQYSLLLEPVTSQEGAEGGSSSSNGGGASSATSDKDEQINRSVAFKGAVEIAASRIQSGTLKPEDAADAIKALTNSLLPVVRGEGPKDIVTKTTRVPVPGVADANPQALSDNQPGPGAAMDPDIPFA